MKTIQNIILSSLAIIMINIGSTYAGVIDNAKGTCQLRIPRVGHKLLATNIDANQCNYHCLGKKGQDALNRARKPYGDCIFRAKIGKAKRAVSTAAHKGTCEIVASGRVINRFNATEAYCKAYGQNNAPSNNSIPFNPFLKYDQLAQKWKVKVSKASEYLKKRNIRPGIAYAYYRNLAGQIKSYLVIAYNDSCLGFSDKTNQTVFSRLVKGNSRLAQSSCYNVCSRAVSSQVNARNGNKFSCIFLKAGEKVGQPLFTPYVKKVTK